MIIVLIIVSTIIFNIYILFMLSFISVLNFVTLELVLVSRYFIYWYYLLLIVYIIVIICMPL